VTSWWSPHKLIEQPDVEDIVQPGVGRKLEAIGNIVDDDRDAVWPIEAGS
jgi:hypothetical protein